LSTLRRFLSLRLASPGPAGPVTHDSRLDGLRGFAAVSVMMVHGFWFDAGPNGPAILKPGEYLLTLHMSRIAVLLFFVTSGYVIGLTNRQAFSGALARNYLRRRLLRLMPIYLLAVAGGWLAFRNIPVWTVLGNLLFLQNPAGPVTVLPGNLPLWSLHNEAVYYLGFLLLWKFKPPAAPLALVMVALAAADWFFGGPLSFLGGWAVGGLFWVSGLLLAWHSNRPAQAGKKRLLGCLLLAATTNHLWPGVLLLKGLGFPYAGESTVWLSDLVYLPIAVVIFCAVMNLDFPGLRQVRWLAIAIPVATVILLQLMGRLWASIPWTMAGVAAIAALPVLALEQRDWGEKFIGLFRPLGPISYALYVFHVPCVALWSVLYPWSGSWLNYAGGWLAWLAFTLLVSWICEAHLQPAVVGLFRRNRKPAGNPA
jgi:peptidoglycan/LPS O-acetylase OafA/YrhL